MKESNFASYMNEGICLTFSNGYTISIRWGPGNYCSRKPTPQEPTEDWSWLFAAQLPKNLEQGWHSRTAEVSVWTGDGQSDKDLVSANKLLNPTSKSTYSSKTEGWLNTDDVAKLIYTVSSIQVKGKKVWDRMKIW